MGRGNESLFVKFGLHDQDGRHAHISLGAPGISQNAHKKGVGLVNRP